MCECMFGVCCVSVHVCMLCVTSVRGCGCYVCELHFHIMYGVYNWCVCVCVCVCDTFR